MKKVNLIITVILTVLILAACDIPADNIPANTPDINPKAETANKDTMNVMLYFCYRGEDFLAGETRTIDVPVNDTPEAAVVRALIKGPSAGIDELSGLFWDKVSLVDISSNEDILFVTLSDEFISTEPDKITLADGTVQDQKKLAIYSIVNTLIEMGKYSRVQIYVDRENTETGERITKSEAGWEDGSNVYLEPLGRDEDVVLTPENTLKQALESFGYKDWTRLYDFTAYSSPDGTVKPDMVSFSDALSSKGNGLDDYSIKGSNVSFDGKTSVVMLDYSIKTRAGDTVAKTNIPVLMVRTNDIWKLSYTSLVNLFVNAG